MDLIETIKADGKAKGMCRQFQMKLTAGLSVKELAKLFIQGIEFCISEDFPTLDFLRDNFKGKCEPYGFYIDEDLTPQKNKPDIVLNGACRAMLEYDSYSVSRLYIRHESEAAVVASDNAIVTIDLFNNTKLHIHAIDNARVYISCYGGNVDIDFFDKADKSRVEVKFYDKNSY